ncbi:MAG: hypothetical protein HUJ86_06645, partial [Synergistes sp.]|nr:hypothetical protein [Synergistes sp.]
PSILMESVKSVYGEEQTELLYGNVLPIEKNRIIAPEDGETLPFGDKGICCFYTLGHAKHHMSFFEENSGALFAGDAFGLSYSWMTPAGTDWTEGLRWTIPTTSPTQFDPLASIESYNQILKRAEGKVYLTHFGELRIVEENAALLTEEIKDHVEIAIAAKGDEKTIKERLAGYYGSLCEKFNTPLPKATIEESLAEAIELNAQGLAFWYTMKRK